VELSAKESKAKEEEKNYKLKTLASQGYTSDSPVQNLRDPAKWKKTDSNKQP